MIRNILSKNTKRNIRLLQRRCRDILEGRTYAFRKDLSFEGEIQKEMEIVVFKGQFFENKIHNLKLVAQRINSLIIEPNQYFSFWKIVGEANLKNGFKEGRNLIGGEISSDVGGGICQYSSLLYFFFVNVIGVKIIERHSHSLDIYKEHERFVPLGADATVSYGFKDFQFQNLLSFPFQLKTEVRENSIILQLIANKNIFSKILDFEYKEVENGVFVITVLDGQQVNTNFYKRL